MKTVIKNLNSSKKVAFLLYGMMFMAMFACNVLTPYIVDDFSYCLNFVTRQPLSSVWDIFPSMVAHANRMNGRLSAHFLVQLFSLMPTTIFDLVNAGFFCLLVWLIASYSSEKTNNLLTASIFCAIWMYEPVFGQVNLWQDGAINYLWAAVFCLVYVKPFVKMYVDKAFPIEGIFVKICFLIFSVFVGSYSEATSVAAIFISFVLVVLSAREQNWKINWYALVSLTLAVVGYLTIYLAPAQWANKSIEMSITSLLLNILNATNVYASFGILAAVAVVMLIVNLFGGAPQKKMMLGMVFAAGSLAANYIMVMASYYPERAAVGAFVFLLTVVVIWLPSALENRQWRIAAISAMAVLVLATIPVFLTGLKEITRSYQEISTNEQLIHMNRSDGIMHVEIPMIYPKSKYCALYGLKYLDTEDATSWPNITMAIYYGVESIIGIK